MSVFFSNHQPSNNIVIDRSNPLTNGLFSFLHPIASPMIDVVANERCNDPYNGQSFILPKYSKYGLSRTNNSSTLYRSFSRSIDGGANGWSVLSILEPQVNITTQSLNSYLRGTSSWNPVEIWVGVGGIPRFSGRSVGGARDYIHGPTYEIGELYVCLTTSGQAGTRFWINGEFIGENTDVFGQDSYQRNLAIYSPSATSNRMRYYGAGGWNRELSFEESKEITTDPWSIFYRNPKKFKLFFTSAPVGNTYNESISESSSITETSSNIAELQKSQSDINTISDQNTNFIHTFPDIVESITNTETSIGNSVSGNAVSENISVSDSSGNSVSSNQYNSDSNSLSDTQILDNITTTEIGDSISYSESINKNSVSSKQVEELSTTNELSTSNGVYSSQNIESGIVSNTSYSITNTNSILLDSNSSSEQNNVLQELSVAQFDSRTIVDISSTDGQTNLTQSDSVNTDTIESNYRTNSGNLSDTISNSETLISSFATNKNISESLSSGDSRTTSFSGNSTQIDIITSADNRISNGEFSSTTQDIASYSDIISRNNLSSSGIIDSLSSSDQLDRYLIHTVDLVEDSISSDFSDNLIFFNSNSTDVISIIENFDISGEFQLNSGDTLYISDSNFVLFIPAFLEINPKYIVKTKEKKVGIEYKNKRVTIESRKINTEIVKKLLNSIVSTKSKSLKIIKVKTGYVIKP